MVSEKKADPDKYESHGEVEQLTEIYLLKEIRLTLVEIRDEVKTIGTILVMAGIITVAILLGLAIGTVLGWFV